MKLDRDIPENRGRGKYAVVRLRKIEDGSEAAKALWKLHELGHLDWGYTNAEDEFFVIKLRDVYSAPALDAYADAVKHDALHEQDEAKSKSLFQYAIAVKKLCGRAGILSPFCKQPD